VTNKLPKFVQNALNKNYLKSIIPQKHFIDRLNLIRELALKNTRTNSKLPKLYLTSNSNQSSFIRRNLNNESAIFFDVGESLLLKSSFSKMFNGYVLPTGHKDLDLLSLMFTAASLSASKSDEKYADLIGDSRSQPYLFNFLDDRIFDSVTGSLSGYLTSSNLQLFSLIVDASILGHECYHYRFKEGFRDNNITKFLDQHYDQFVQESVEVDFSYFTNMRTTTKAKLKTQDEAKLRLNRYKHNKNHLIEEIECDLFGLKILLEFLENRSFQNLNEIEILDKATPLYFLDRCLHLLHTGTIKRTHFYRTHHKQNYLPDDLGDFNLRRVALAHYSSELVARAKSQQIRDSAERLHSFNVAYQACLEELGKIYYEVCELFLMPCIVRLNDSFACIEEVYPLPHRKGAKGVTSHEDRLFYSGLSYRVDQKYITEIFLQNPFG